MPWQTNYTKILTEGNKFYYYSCRPGIWPIQLSYFGAIFVIRTLRALLAINNGILRFQPLLEGDRSVIKTDHKLLTFAFLQLKSNSYAYILHISR